MVSITALTTVVVLATAAAAADFKQPCNAPYDVCGWELTNGVYGYNPQVLFNAASAAGQDPTNSSIVFDSIYSCGDNGAIQWNHPCDHGCNAPDFGPNSNCRQ